MAKKNGIYVPRTEKVRKMIGTSIRSFRLQRQMSQKSIAALLKITQATQSRIEKGRREVSGSQIFKLARHFGVSTDELLMGTQPQAHTDSFDSEE